MKKESIVPNLYEYARVSGDEEGELMIAAAREIRILEEKLKSATSALKRLTTLTNITANERIAIAKEALDEMKKASIESVQ